MVPDLSRDKARYGIVKSSPWKTELLSPCLFIHLDLLLSNGNCFAILPRQYSYVRTKFNLNWLTVALYFWRNDCRGTMRVLPVC